MYGKDADLSNVNILHCGSKESKSKIPRSSRISFEADPFAIMMDGLYPVMGSMYNSNNLNANESEVKSSGKEGSGV